MMVEELTPKDRSSLEKKLKGVKIPYHVVDKADGVLTNDERKHLLLSLKGVFAYMGIMLPQSLTLDDGTVLKLKDLVWGLIAKKDLTDEEVVAARELANILNKRIEDNRALIDRYDVTEEQAEKLYFLTAGLLRAVMELRGLGMRDREEEYAKIARERHVDDAKKILAFFRDVGL
jgi:hypothetical protein